MKKLLLGVLFAAACTAPNAGHSGHGNTGGNGGDVDMGGGGNGNTGNDNGGSDGGTTASQGCDKMDILFVVDNSGSMSEEQTNLADNFPKFIDVLNNYKTGTGNALDYHVGITTTSLTETSPIPLPIPIPLPPGDDGALRNTASCGMSRAWVERSDSDPAGEFSCAAKVGTDGSGMEQPLEAARLAFTDRIADGKNAGFVRDGALLAVVILTDEDDQSVDPKASTGMELPVDDFISAFDQVKGGERGRWATSVIAGPTDCMSQFGSATEAVRLKDYVQKSGKQAVFSSICDGDLAKSLDEALKTFSAACDSFPPIGFAPQR